MRKAEIEGLVHRVIEESPRLAHLGERMASPRDEMHHLGVEMHRLVGLMEVRLSRMDRLIEIARDTNRKLDLLVQAFACTESRGRKWRRGD